MATAGEQGLDGADQSGRDAACRDGGEGLRRDMLALMPDLRAFARFLLRDRAMADDLVQDTVVRALAALPQFRPGTNLKAWLFTILRNLFYEQVRRRRRETAALDAHPAPHGAMRPEQAAAAELRDLQHLLWRLPPLLREALVLVGAQELTHEQAAQICGVPVGTMKARVSRARTQLTQIMQPAGTNC